MLISEWSSDVCSSDLDEPGVGYILIHFTVLQPHGRRSLPEGARVECIAVQRDRGLQARETVSIDLSDAIEPAPRPRGGHAAIEALADAAGAFEPVRVKWFNWLQGYGSLVREAGAIDILLHRKSGGLGQRVASRVALG